MAKRTMVRNMVNCDRCGREIDSEETTIAEAAEANSSDKPNPAFNMTLAGFNTIWYEDLCSNCIHRLETLFGQAGKVTRSRRGGSREKKDTNGEAVEAQDSKKGKKSKKAPSKPVVPATA